MLKAKRIQQLQWKIGVDHRELNKQTKQLGTHTFYGKPMMAAV